MIGIGDPNALPLESPGLWAAFLGGVIALLLLDLGVLHRSPRAVSSREALLWSIIWVTLSLVFNGWVYFQFGKQPALEFLSAYLVEKSLSVDNLFVFIVIFRYMRVDPHSMHRVLFAGIVGALVLRGAFIVVGIQLIEHFSWMLYVFGGFLLFTGLKLLFTDEDSVDPSETLTYRLARRVLPLSRRYHGTRFTVRTSKGLKFTPLFLVLLMIETSDVVFALDSIPAVFGISRAPFIVFASNVCAVLGLRAMFFLLQNVLDRFAYLKYGLGLVLVFIGGKMVLAEGIPGLVAPIHVPIVLSLGVVTALIAGSMLLSWLRPPDGGSESQIPDMESSLIASVADDAALGESFIKLESNDEDGDEKPPQPRG